jgi:hypothetical protein
MLSRRIAAGACALCLAVPAVAGAQPTHDQSPAKSGPVAYGDTKYDLQNGHDLAGDTTNDVSVAQQVQQATAGDTKDDLSVAQQYERAIAGDTKGNLPRAIAPAPDATPSYADRVGSLTPQQLAAAYGTTKPAAPAHASVASDSDGTNGWRLAAVIEAALLAAFAIAAAVLLSGRARRTPRMGM